jgi:hypothetical protein
MLCVLARKTAICRNVDVSCGGNVNLFFPLPSAPRLYSFPASSTPDRDTTASPGQPQVDTTRFTARKYCIRSVGARALCCGGKWANPIGGSWVSEE